jgi:hypothetical protein
MVIIRQCSPVPHINGAEGNLQEVWTRGAGPLFQYSFSAMANVLTEEQTKSKSRTVLLR